MKILILNEIFRLLAMVELVEAEGLPSGDLWTWIEIFNRKFEFLC